MEKMLTPQGAVEWIGETVNAPPMARPVNRGKIVQGALLPTDPNPINYTLAIRMHWIHGDKRANPHRFSGKRVRQHSGKLANIQKRDRRLRKYGWPLNAFVS